MFTSQATPASLIFTLIIFSIFSVSTAKTTPSNITRGASLTPKNISAWLSSSGMFAFGFYPEGNGYKIGIYIAKIPEKTVVWTANRDDSPFSSNSTLLLTNRGKLAVRSLQGDDLAIIVEGPIYSASMLDSGNFVCYSSSGSEIYHSFYYPTDTILPGQSLTGDQELVSSASASDHSSGSFRLKMQHDGNLAQYPLNTSDTRENCYWSSRTSGLGSSVSLNFDSDGHLYMSYSSNIIKNLTDGTSPYGDTIFIMRIDVDGIFRTYSHPLGHKENWSIEWESSQDKCEAYGLCGVNGFCVMLDKNFACKCLPGFHYVNPGNWSLGCERNFTVDNCKKENQTISYSMIPLNRTTWEDLSYSKVSLGTEEDCQKSCLEDCNCEAALFEDGSCRKQRLPLQYGKISNEVYEDINVAFVKIGLFSNKSFVHPPEKKEEEEDNWRTAILIIGISLVVFSFLFLAVSCTVIYTCRVWVYKRISGKWNVEVGEDMSLRTFTLTELERITKGFGEELGRGAFGTVYKGDIPYSKEILAVKKLDKALADGEREFRTEIKVIGRAHHRNLVRLIGYCLEGANRLLVYEYMNNGSLADLIHKPENRPSWDERIAIALDIAKGILYLHEECETPIIHCDIKPSNILMDKNMRAKISDFGLAKLLKPDQTRTYTDIRGTRGYLAPEWQKKFPVTVKADVYSFGVMLFEIICCRKSVDWTLPEEEAVLEEWVKTCFNANLLRKLVGEEEEVSMCTLESVVRVGLLCIQEEPSLRPPMRKVMLMLDGTVEITVPPGPNSFLCTT